MSITLLTADASEADLAARLVLRGTNPQVMALPTQTFVDANSWLDTSPAPGALGAEVQFSEFDLQ
eukprot:7376352-Prymnesium_polylepis.1